MRLSRPIGGGVHTLHELFQLGHELGDARSSGEFGERRHLVNLRSDTQVRLVDWIRLLQLRRLELHGIKRQKVPEIQGLEKHRKNNSLAC